MNNPMDFSFTMKGVDTAFPSLAVAENIPFRFIKWEPKSTKNPGEVMLRIQVETLEPATDTKGREQKPGFKTGFNIILPNEATPEDQLKMRQAQMALFIDAMHGTNEDNRPDFSAELLNASIGKTFLASTKKSKNDEFGETEISGRSFKHIPEQAAS